jgi:hypothetical protein
MKRRRTNRELKNSEDVQDAIIEDYFRYDDLSRMEAADIFQSSYYWTDRNRANTENIRIGLVFVVLAQ